MPSWAQLSAAKTKHAPGACAANSAAFALSWRVHSTLQRGSGEMPVATASPPFRTGEVPIECYRLQVVGHLGTVQQK